MHHSHSDHDHTPHAFDEHILEPDGPLEENPLWQRDNVVLTSVGIDIGSSGTQILFSRVQLHRQSIDLSSRYLVVARETLYESPVSLTPYASETLIDARALGEIVDHAYHLAQLQPHDIDTGVVILTGEALRRKNSEPIARILSEKCGELVCATAGHHMEAVLAARGSGAAQLSHDRNECVLNMDIGGGTTKLSVIDKGEILSTAAIHIGARLLAVDDRNCLERIDPAGATHAERAGFRWKKGQQVTDEQLQQVANSMASDLIAAVTGKLSQQDMQDLYLTDPIQHLDRVESIVCSGGVAEYIYHREAREFGDLGLKLGHALRSRIDEPSFPWQLLTESQGIRSTVLGCSEFTVQLSGNTGYISNHASLLPMRNLKVVRPAFEFTDEFDGAELAAAIQARMVMFEVDPVETVFALALHWRGAPKYKRISQLARGISMALDERIAQGKPVYIILDADIAMNLGSVLEREYGVKSGLMVVDGIALWDFDSVDIGQVKHPSMTVPVTIKSLVFGDVEGGNYRRELVHHPKTRHAGPVASAQQ